MNKKSLLTLVALVSASATYAQTFPGVGVGALPDGGPGCGVLGVPLDITFAVTDVFPPLVAVEVDMEASHSWVGDLGITLIAPDATEHLILSATGSTTATGCGDSSDLGGVYNFTNDTTGDWWAEAAAGLGADIMTAGDYQTSEAGADAASTGAVTDMNAAFAAVADPNGTWTLRITDSGGGDTGDVTAANLFLMGGADPDIIFADGFETTPPI